MKPLLSIIIVSYNTADLTIQTLSSVQTEYEQSSLLHKKLEVVVVDNNSTDTSVSKLRTFKKTAPFPVHIIANATNSGFGAANNQGIAHSTGKYILALNSDTIVQKKALTHLVASFEAIQNPEATASVSSEHSTLDKVGIIAATLLNADGTIQPQGGDLPNLASLAAHMFFLDDIPFLNLLLPTTQHTGLNNPQQHIQNDPQNPSLIPIGWVGGTAMCLSREMLDEIGVFDEHIFMYGEDIELCLRAKKHLWDCAIHPQAKIIHLQNQSSSSQQAIIGEIMGYVYIWSKHKPLWQKDIATLILQLGCLFRSILFGTIIQNKEKKLAYSAALKKLLAR